MANERDEVAEQSQKKTHDSAAAHDAGASARAAEEKLHGNKLAAQGPQAATFRLIYESRDGKLCLFEDADGHLTSVRSLRLA